jgi:3-oxoacyl-[acyl-carrier protein] reductase
MNKKALITGGSRGIGAGVARHFAARGMDVVLTYQASAEKGEAVARSIKDDFGVRCEAIACDVREFTHAKAAVEKALVFLDGLDVLVNNAGITRDQSFLTMSPEEWGDVIATNLTGAFNVTRAAVSTFLRQKRGAIIQMSSVAGCIGLAGMANYASSKAGLHGFTRALARECAPRGVTVNAIAPGFIETDMSAALDATYRAQMTAQVPLKRFGTVEEVAALTHFLTTDDARYITGQVFVIDGGVSL